MEPLHIATPLIESPSLAAARGGRVWLKLECLQPSGSFKNRGMGAACRGAAERGALRLVSSSGGNAGLAVAYSGRRLGIPVTIVVPESTGQRPRALIAAEGAEVLVHGTAWDDAHHHALEICASGEAAYIHPFDSPEVWKGNSSMIDEVAGAGLRPDLVVVAVGGGGLFCGVMEGLDRHGLGEVPVLALETEGAASLHASVRAGRLVELARIESIATTLGARRVTPQALEYARRPTVTSRTVTDRQALNACFKFAWDHRVLVEPACGAALAAVYENLPPVPGSQNLLVIVCGGAGVSLEALEKWGSQLSDAS